MRFGHLAFSQTVSSFNSLSNSEVNWFPLPLGTSRLSQLGSLRLGSNNLPDAGILPPIEPHPPIRAESVCDAGFGAEASEPRIGRIDFELMSLDAFMGESFMGCKRGWFKGSMRGDSAWAFPTADLAL
jgi:hypothetical protein